MEGEGREGVTHLLYVPGMLSLTVGCKVTRLVYFMTNIPMRRKMTGRMYWKVHDRRSRTKYNMRLWIMAPKWRPK